MSWDRIEGNWAQFTGNADERWGSLNDCQLASRVEDTYGTTDGEEATLRRLTDWQERLGEIERAAH